MKAQALLTELTTRGVAFQVRGDKLRFRPQERLTRDEVEAVRQLKPALIELLNDWPGRRTVFGQPATKLPNNGRRSVVDAARCEPVVAVDQSSALGKAAECMAAAALMDELRIRGVELRVDGDRLQYFPREALSVEQRELVRRVKPAIMRLLRGPADGHRLARTRALRWVASVEKAHANTDSLIREFTKRAKRQLEDPMLNPIEARGIIGACEEVERSLGATHIYLSPIRMGSPLARWRQEAKEQE